MMTCPFLKSLSSKYPFLPNNILVMTATTRMVPHHVLRQPALFSSPPAPGYPSVSTELLTHKAQNQHYLNHSVRFSIELFLPSRNGSIDLTILEKGEARDSMGKVRDRGNF